jgi:polysaccharide biosynthesis transport protein
MDLAAYLRVFRRRWLTIVVVALAVLAVTAIVTLLLPQKYTATTRLFFGVQSGQVTTDLTQGSTFAEKQMSSYAQVALSPLVLAPVIRDLGLTTTPEILAESVSATVPPDTVILEIGATSTDPVEAARISNAIGAELASVVAKLSPDRPDGTESVRATTLAPATVPIDPSSPDVLRNIALGAVLGLLLGVGAALAKESLDTKLRSETDVRATVDVPLLGVIPFDPTTPSHLLVMSDGQGGARAEAVRRLRTNLQFVGAAGEPRTIVISSSISGEGKTTTAINLAAALADAGLKVLLIDADLRRPSVGEYLGLEGRVGLTSVLIGKAQLSEVTQHHGKHSLDVLASGPIPPNPSEILGSPAMVQLMKSAAESYDVVILDSPPLLPVTDAAVLSRLAEGTLVVVGADHTHRPQLIGAVEALEGVDAHVLGVVLNKVAKRDASAYGYEYGYGPPGPDSAKTAARATQPTSGAGGRSELAEGDAARPLNGSARRASVAQPPHESDKTRA